jgi:nicotinamide riboside kinase
MRRVAIVGPSGSGKTWLARRLAVVLGVDHAGIPEGHAAADARAQRCRAAHPVRWRYWRYCDRYAR